MQRREHKGCLPTNDCGCRPRQGVPIQSHTKPSSRANTPPLYFLSHHPYDMSLDMFLYETLLPLTSHNARTTSHHPPSLQGGRFAVDRSLCVATKASQNTHDDNHYEETYHDTRCHPLCNFSGQSTQHGKYKGGGGMVITTVVARAHLYPQSNATHSAGHSQTSADFFICR